MKISISTHFHSWILYFRNPQKCITRRKNYRHYYLTQQDWLVSSFEIKQLLTTKWVSFSVSALQNLLSHVKEKYQESHCQNEATVKGNWLCGSSKCCVHLTDPVNLFCIILNKQKKKRKKISFCICNFFLVRFQFTYAGGP